jgi:hypothetical protein
MTSPKKMPPKGSNRYAKTTGRQARWHNLNAGAPRNVREAACLSFPFSFVTFLLGKQKKSKIERFKNEIRQKIELEFS